MNEIFRTRGFSIVELMVAMAISLMLFAGALGIYMSSKNTYVDNDRMARLQEAGRIALDLVSRDLRNAGYHGCVRPGAGRFFNRLNNGDTSMQWDFRAAVTGYNASGASFVGGGNGAPFSAAVVPGAIAGNDVIVLRGPLDDGGTLRLEAATAAADSPLVVEAPPAGREPAVGQIMMVTDCEWSAVFQVTGYAARAIAHLDSGTPGNASPSLEAAFSADGQLLPLRATVYFLAPSGSGSGPALWRRVNRDEPEELIEGVERLQFTYGVDTNSDGVVEEYRNATGVADWSQVAAVQVAMLIRSVDEAGTFRDTGRYQLLDDAPFAATPADRRQRALFTTTVSLRNRTP